MILCDDDGVDLDHHSSSAHHDEGGVDDEGNVMMMGLSNSGRSEEDT